MSIFRCFYGRPMVATNGWAVARSENRKLVAILVADVAATAVWPAVDEERALAPMSDDVKDNGELRRPSFAAMPFARSPFAAQFARKQ
jgi:hypothetical protein